MISALLLQLDISDSREHLIKSCLFNLISIFIRSVSVWVQDVFHSLIAISTLKIEFLQQSAGEPLGK